MRTNDIRADLVERFQKWNAAQISNWLEDVLAGAIVLPKGAPDQSRVESLLAVGHRVSVEALGHLKASVAMFCGRLACYRDRFGEDGVSDLLALVHAWDVGKALDNLVSVCASDDFPEFPVKHRTRMLGLLADAPARLFYLKPDW